MLWNGFVRYDGSRRYPIWVRARIRVELRQVIAGQDLPQGRPVSAQQLRVETREGPPPREPMAQTIEQISGRIPRRGIRAGTPIALAQVEEPNDVNGGDMVHIGVKSGAAQLSFVGQAVTAGRIGQTITVRNLESGKTFSARVESKGNAVVIALETGAAAPGPSAQRISQ